MDRRIKKTTATIFTSYIKIKGERPETEPSVKEICAKADINKTTFYRYYDDVESLSRALTEYAAHKLLVENLDVETLLTDPENYFAKVLERFAQYEEYMKGLLYSNPNNFICAAESIMKSKLKEVSKKYDEVLCTFIAGGAAHYFLSENYSDENELKKFCRIIRAATEAI